MINLKKLIPYLDEIMQTFYDDMLSHKQLAIFFRDENHIQALIQKQKDNFVDSLDDNPQQLEQRYLKLGAFHYDLRVPSADFLKSTNLWRTSFISYAINQIRDIELIQKIDNYFKEVDAKMSQGYLSRQLDVDKNDLLALIKQYQENRILKEDSILKHLEWLYKILLAVQQRDVDLAPDLDIDSCTTHSFFQIQSEDIQHIFSNEHLEDLHIRLHIDAQSLFYFIEKGDFPEVLSLYSNLLSVYKITLITLGNYNLNQHAKNLNQQLNVVNKEIQTLQGIIPICMHCKEIRDVEGAWNQLEKYISEHSDAEFSHGICEKCMDKIYK